GQSQSGQLGGQLRRQHAAPFGRAQPVGQLFGGGHGAAAPAEGGQVDPDGGTVELDGSLDGGGGDRDGSLLVGRSEHEDVGGGAVAEQGLGGGGTVDPGRGAGPGPGFEGGLHGRGVRVGLVDVHHHRPCGGRRGGTDHHGVVGTEAVQVGRGDGDDQVQRHHDVDLGPPGIGG